MPVNKDKIDWTEKFKEFLANYNVSEERKEFILKFFTFTKRMNTEIQPSDIESIYNEIHKRKHE